MITQYNIKHNPKYVFGSVFINSKVRKALLVDKKGLKLFAKMMSKNPRSAFNFLQKQSEHYKEMIGRIMTWHALLGSNNITEENIDETLNVCIKINEDRLNARG